MWYAQSMNILYTNFHEGYGGGQTTYITTLARHLVNHNNIWIATPLNSDLFETAKHLGFNVLPIKFKHGFFDVIQKFKYAKQLRQLIRKQNIDVIHVNGSADHKLIRLCLLGLKNKPKVIFTKHNSFALKPSSKNRLLHACDSIICVSEFTKQQLINEGVPASKLHTIYNGIDILHYQPVDIHKRLNIRKKYHIADDEFVLGSVAGNAPYKGWHYLTEALIQLKDTPFKVVLAGEDIGDETYDRYITANNLQDKVIFTGKVSDVRKIIPAFDVGFVLSDSVETISFACREMMAMGVPTIVSNYAGLPENIINEEDGWVVPKSDSQSLVSFLPKLLKQDLSPLKNAARKKAIQQFDVNTFVKQTELCYQH